MCGIASLYEFPVSSYKEDGLVRTNKINMGLNELTNAVTELTVGCFLFGHVSLLWPSPKQTLHLNTLHALDSFVVVLFLLSNGSLLIFSTGLLDILLTNGGSNGPSTLDGQNALPFTGLTKD